MPASPPASRRPRGRRRPAQEEGRPRPAGPLPAPQLSRLPRLNSSPPAFLLRPRSGSFPKAAAAAHSSPRLGRRARPRRARGAPAAVSRAQGGGRRQGGAAVASGWEPSPASWGLRAPLPSLGSPGSRLGAADRRHLGEAEKARAAREPQSSSERRLRLRRGNPARARAPSASNKNSALAELGAGLGIALSRARTGGVANRSFGLHSVFQ